MGHGAFQADRTQHTGLYSVRTALCDRLSKAGRRDSRPRTTHPGAPPIREDVLGPVVEASALKSFASAV
jgi:hypothetical protein